MENRELFERCKEALNNHPEIRPEKDGLYRLTKVLDQEARDAIDKLLGAEPGMNSSCFISPALSMLEIGEL